LFIDRKETMGHFVDPYIVTEYQDEPEFSCPTSAGPVNTTKQHVNLFLFGPVARMLVRFLEITSYVENVSK
jgi:hypothetical protein